LVDVIDTLFVYIERYRMRGESNTCASWKRITTTRRK